MLQSNPRTCFLFCQCQSLLYSSQDPLNSLLSTTCFTHHYWFFIDLKSPPLPPPLFLPTIQIASAPLQGEKEAWAWHWFLHRLFSPPILYFCFGHWPLFYSFFSVSLSLSLFFSVSQSYLNVSRTSRKLLDCRNCGKYCPPDRLSPLSSFRCLRSFALKPHFMQCLRWLFSSGVYSKQTSSSGGTAEKAGPQEQRRRI